MAIGELAHKGNLLLPNERLDLLVRLLAAGYGSAKAEDLRQTLLGDIKALEGTFIAATRRQLNPAAIDALTNLSILHMPTHENSAKLDLVAQLAKAKRLHKERRQML